MTAAPIVTAATLSATTQVVTAADHVTIVSKLKSDLIDLQLKAEALWATHEVLVIAVSSFILGAVAFWTFIG